MWKWKRLSVIARCERGISVDSRRSLDAAEWSLQPAASRSLDVCLTARLARQQRRDAPGCVSEDVVTEVAVVFCLTSSPSIQSSILLFSVGPFLQYTEALMLPKWANVNLSTVFPDKSSLCLETEVRMTEKIILSLYGCPHTLLFACLCRCVSSCDLIIKTPPVDIQLHFNLGLNMCVEIY